MKLECAPSRPIARRQREIANHTFLDSRVIQTLLTLERTIATRHGTKFGHSGSSDNARPAKICHPFMPYQVATQHQKTRRSVF